MQPSAAPSVEQARRPHPREQRRPCDELKSAAIHALSARYAMGSHQINIKLVPRAQSQRELGSHASPTHFGPALMRFDVGYAGETRVIHRG
jgi:hypothetical protein